MSGNTLTSLPSEKLSKTSAEQSIVRNIQILETEFEAQESAKRKHELRLQIDSLKEELQKVQGPSYGQIEHENFFLKEKVKELENTVAGLRNTCRETDSGMKARAGKENQLKLYRLLLERYAGQLNETEKRTVGEIKVLVNENDLTVQAIVNDIRPEGYSFDGSYLSAARKAFEFITKKVEFVEHDLALNFWLSPKEIVSESVGDDKDLAVFLCSLLLALGDEKAEVVVARLSNRETHAFVVTIYGKRFLLLDPSQKTGFDEFAGQKEEVLLDYSFRGAKIDRLLYKFNKNNYAQFVED